MTSIMSSDFHFHVHGSFHKKLVQIGKVVSEKIRFDFLYVNDLGPRSRNDLDLQCSHIVIKSISFRLQAAIVSENPLSSLFLTFKPKLQNLTLA